MSISREQLDQKMLLCSELAMKASLLGLCRSTVEFCYNNQSFNCSVCHVNTTDFHSVINVHFFADQVLEFPDLPFSSTDFFEMDSVIAFFHGILDTRTPFLDPKAVATDQSELEAA